MSTPPSEELNSTPAQPDANNAKMNSMENFPPPNPETKFVLPADQQGRATGIWGPSATTKQKPGYGWGTVVLGFAATLFLPIIPVAIAAIFSAGDIDLEGDPTQATETITNAITTGPVLAISAIFTWLGMLTAVIIAGARTEGGWKKAVNWGWKKIDPLIGLGFGVGMVILSVLSTLLLGVFGIDTSELGNTDMVTDMSGFWLVFMAAGAVIAAPIVEELFFRGVVLKTATRTMSIVPGLIVTSLLFGFMHAQDSLASTVYTVTSTAIVGLFLGILALKTKRLGPSIAGHAVFNFLGVTLALLGT